MKVFITLKILAARKAATEVSLLSLLLSLLVCIQLIVSVHLAKLCHIDGIGCGLEFSSTNGQYWFRPMYNRLAYCYRAMLRRARLFHSISSVSPSVTLRYCDHIGWNISKIITRPNSLRLLLELTPNISYLVEGEHPKIRRE